ncbi:MAG: prephenate dehydrogenase [Anaerolineales bacterium]|nr:prephenate dehydrogenase [Anaerolineales bacterium]
MLLKDTRVCIVGIGLMGGSLALALRGKVAHLMGVDRHAATRQYALREHVVDQVSDDLSLGIQMADLLILATPVQTILNLLIDLPRLCPDGCLLFDLGSTKQTINATMGALPTQFQAIGGHPMCGKETAGLLAADATLYQDQTFILTRNGRTTPTIEQLALELSATIGARPLFLDAVRHDRITAAVSHVPYLISAVLMHQAAMLNDEYVWPVSASGFRDTSRLSGSDPRMMLDILLTNKTAVLDQLNHFQITLAEISDLLISKDETALAVWLTKAQQTYVDYRAHKE